MTGERIIPLTHKDKRKLRRALGRILGRLGAQLAAAFLLVFGLVFFRHDGYYHFFLGASVVLYSAFLVFHFFRENGAGDALRLWRDWRMGKKRVVTGQVVKAEYQESAAGAETIYDIGPYRFTLTQLSPQLKRFRQVMPGQTVEVHQCLHSGLILRLVVQEE